MVPSLKEIAFQIAVMHELYPKEDINELANRLMYSPIFIINALDEGERLEMFTREKGTDKIAYATPLDYSSMLGMEFGHENVRIQNEILRAVATANKDEMDVELGTLLSWLRGIRMSDVEIAIHILKKVGFIHQYELKNQYADDEEYSFLTLKVNEDNYWGNKQFIKPKKKKKE